MPAGFRFLLGSSRDLEAGRFAERSDLRRLRRGEIHRNATSALRCLQHPTTGAALPVQITDPRLLRAIDFTPHLNRH